ncbi:MAG: hypothetical protein JWR08_2627 [Enterovirga sp.]|nr:hypothetical protein [Enterovirga sp.]
MNAAGNAERLVRAAFADQAGWGSKLGSPFTSRIAEAIGSRIDRGTAVGRRVLDWPGNPDVTHDSVPVRLCGGLNALVRCGRSPELARLYPPNPLPDADELWAEVRRTFEDAEAELLAWIEHPPQTNEVARSAILISGVATAAEATGLPVRLFELGASAGLNLYMDRYACRAGSRLLGDPDSSVRLGPAWEGADPPPVTPRILTRRGVDLQPIDVRDPEQCARLLAYVWPDQPDRILRLEGALAIAAADPPPLDRGDAAHWLDGHIRPEAESGALRLVYHSIAFQYFPERTQARILATMERAGAAARPEAPLGWLRYEMEPGAGLTTVRLRLWPDGSDRLLARTDGHARRVIWQA